MDLKHNEQFINYSLKQTSLLPFRGCVKMKLVEFVTSKLIVDPFF